jgi:hypothetical protein
MNDARSLSLRELGAGDVARWNRFVEECQDATFFHRAEWRRVIEKAFGHPTWYWLAEDGEGRVRGVLPLVRVRSWLFGDTLASIPFGVYGGVAAVDETARCFLERQACDLAGRLGVGALEMRNLVQRNPDWPRKDCTSRSARRSPQITRRTSRQCPASSGRWSGRASRRAWSRP